MKAWKHKTNADDIRVVLPDNESLWVFFEPVRVILEGTYARQQAALAAADKKIMTARALAKDAMLKGQLPENEHAIKLVNADIELREARALIAAALKAEEVKR